MTLRDQFEQETGFIAHHEIEEHNLGDAMYAPEYVQWLEAKVQKTEVSEEALEKARQDGYEAGWQDSANHIANTL